MSNLDYHDARAGRLLEVAEVTAGALGERIRSLEKQMRAAAKRLEFEQAAAMHGTATRKSCASCTDR